MQHSIPQVSGSDTIRFTAGASEQNSSIHRAIITRVMYKIFLPLVIIRNLVTAQPC